MFTSLIAGMLISSAHAQATAATTSDEMFRQCVKTCTAWEDQPGYALNACISECQRRHLKKETAGVLMKSVVQFCETYEECDVRD